MKARMRAWSVVAVVIAGMALLRGAAPAGEGAMRLGYVSCSLAHPFQVRLLDAARAEAERLGVALEVRDTGEDAAAQAEQIRGLLASGVDALVVVAADGVRVDEIVARARRAGTPLVFANRNPFPGQRPPDNVYYVGADPFVEGETQMRFAGHKVGANGRILVLQGKAENLASRGRSDGVRSVASGAFPEVAMLAEAPANWVRDQAHELTLQWIDAFGALMIDAILAGNDIMALGAVDALEERGLDDVVVVGVDASPEALAAIREGRLTGTVNQDAVTQGSMAVRVARDAVVGAKQAQVHILPSEMITGENVSRYL